MKKSISPPKWIILLTVITIFACCQGQDNMIQNDIITLIFGTNGQGIPFLKEALWRENGEILFFKVYSSDKPGHLPFWKIANNNTIFFSISWCGGWQSDISQKEIVLSEIELSRIKLIKDLQFILNNLSESNVFNCRHHFL